MLESLILFFPYAVAYTIPLLITSLGGLFSERSGVINICLEGLMVVGSFTCALVIILLTPHIGDISIWIGIVAAFVAGAVFSLLHAFASIHLNSNQVISGIAVNMMAFALTVASARTITGSGNLRISQGLPRIDIPLFSDLPLIGPMFFQQSYMTTWLILFLLILGTILLYKTPFGLRLRTCGENPKAATSVGIKVSKIRYIAVMISGSCAGLGGAAILITYSGEFNGTVSGLGFLALAALIFGQWKPLGVLGASFFFGLATTIANASQAEPAFQIIPEILLKIFPYVVTLVALIIFSRSSQAPKALGQPFHLE